MIARGGRFLGLALSLSLVAACRNAPQVTAGSPPPVDGPIRITSQPVPLNPDDPAQTGIGRFRYAGGISITSPDTSRLHGQSDLKIGPDGALYAQGDEGDVLDARLQTDAAGRLVGLTDADMSRLQGPDGAELTGKPQTDAEGLATLPNGERLVSFENQTRILRYPAGGAAPVEAPIPDGISFPENEGLEALTAFPPAGDDAYLIGGEQGQLWLCRLSAGCVALPPVIPPPSGFGLTALAVLPGPEDGPQGEAPSPLVAFLQRAYDPAQGNRIIVTIVRFNGTFDANLTTEVVDRFTMERPLTRDNFEGIAAVRNREGGVRLYLLSDDNFNPAQRTLLMAFDWTPPAPPAAPSPATAPAGTP